VMFSGMPGSMDAELFRITISLTYLLRMMANSLILENYIYLCHLTLRN